MENASKALLIAGEMLITMLLLSLFAYLYSQMTGDARNVYDFVQESEISQFNQPFLNYEGKSDMSIQDVATVVNLAINNNNSEKMPVTISVIVDGSDWALVYSQSESQILEEHMQDVIDKTLYKCERIEYADQLVKDIIINTVRK